MAVFGTGGGQTSSGGSNSEVLKQNPSISKQLLTLADTEYIISLPAGRVSYLVRPRQAAILKVASATGNIALGDYITVSYGNNIFDNKVDPTATINLYVSSSLPNTILEIWCWT